MGTPAPIKTDLVIGMTLAETFLLILLVVWYSHGPGAGLDWKKRADDRADQINKLNAELQLQKDKRLQLERIFDWWVKNFPTSPPGSMDELQGALRSRGFVITKVDQGVNGAKPGGRSNLTPSCSELHLKGILFNTVISGRDSYEVNGQKLNFQDLLNAYQADLREANENCKFSINVSYQQDVRTDDFVFALTQLRRKFYVQLP
jgi:hypothetical protein